MNRFHPALAPLLLLVLVVFLWLQATTLHQTFVREQEAFVSLQMQVQQWSETKQQWLGSYAKLRALLKDPQLQQLSYKEEGLKSSVVISFEKITPDQLTTLMNKVLNSTIVLNKMHISKETEGINVRIEIEK